MRLWLAVLAGLQVVSGGTILLEIWDRRWVGLFVLIVAAAQVGTAAYMKPEQELRHDVHAGAPERQDPYSGRHHLDYEP